MEKVKLNKYLIVGLVFLSVPAVIVIAILIAAALMIATMAIVSIPLLGFTLGTVEIFDYFSNSKPRKK